MCFLGRARRAILPGCVYEYFSEQDGYDFLPFKHVQLVYVDEDVPDSLIWVCRYCNFWCEVFDPPADHGAASVCSV
jgi:hypothetical protein